MKYRTPGTRFRIQRYIGRDHYVGAILLVFRAALVTVWRLYATTPSRDAIATSAGAVCLFNLHGVVSPAQGLDFESCEFNLCAKSDIRYIPASCRGRMLHVLPCMHAGRITRTVHGLNRWLKSVKIMMSRKASRVKTWGVSTEIEPIERSCGGPGTNLPTRIELSYD